MASNYTYLKNIALDVRKDVLDIIYQTGSGHIGGSLSSTDILVALYFSNLFNFYPLEPDYPKRDRFILSAGHLALGLYSVLCRSGFFDEKLLYTYAQLKSPLQGHAHRLVPGVEYSSGSLGQGLSVAAGMALADQKDRQKRFTLCLTSDGEHNQGQVWEAAMFAAKYDLNHLINLVDQNGIQIGGTTQKIMPLGDLASKYYEFGWQVYEIDGHNFSALLRTLTYAKESAQKPVVIIAKTILAKGISFMEGKYQYHDLKNLSEKKYKKAISCLEKKSKLIK
jgi:transketolase